MQTWKQVTAAAAFAVAALVTARPASAQYFGQNKVQYRSFPFQIIQTEHFEVYFYDEERAAALDAARMAERGYARLSRVLHHRFQARKPIILYASHTDFEQTNAIEGELGEGTGGVTEFFKHRMVLPFTGSYADLEHVLQHEMVHQFQYDVFSSGRIGAGVQTLVSVNPPLWFMEGMAEYLSLGPIDPHTAMWLRDAALEGDLPTIEQMTYDPRVFPYHYGHALWSYIGEKWGDEVIGEILQASTSSGVEGAFKRALGLSLEDLSNEWRDAVQTTFLPQLSEHYRARRIAQPLLTEKRTGGGYHLAPALTPDGREVAFFGERNSFFIDLYLADAESGRTLRRLVKSTINSNYESLRFVNSSGSFSPDGRYFAITAKRKQHEDLVILDVKRGREERRIQIPLNGLETPAWSPDGQQLVFTGFDGGLSDLFVVNRDGSGLRRLTTDKYADLQPAWSPDGKTIAFTTDRGGETSFEDLRFGRLRLPLYHLDSGTIELLGHMGEGKNINPAWSPDGRSLAFVSDRTGISNLFLYDFSDGSVYQLTDVFTGVSGITPVSPALSWARQADRLAFAYYENGEYNVYSVDNPRSLRRQPYEDRPAPGPTMLLVAGAHRDTTRAAAVRPDTSTAPPTAGYNNIVSVYRPAGGGFRPSGGNPPPGDSTAATTPLSVRTLLDSASLSLPDTTEFSVRPYHVRFSPDYTARPTIGYARDNFGRGFFGGAAVSLSDMLGDHTLQFAGAVNGRISEAQIFAAYINQRHRLNWGVGGSQSPYYFYLPSTVNVVDDNNPGGADSILVYSLRIQRYVVRDVFAESYYPLSRFSRVELGLHGVSLGVATLTLSDGYDLQTGQYLGSLEADSNQASLGYAQPSVGLVHDNALFGYVGPFAGSRSRFSIAPAFGNKRFTTITADYRRYLFFRPFTLAFRGLFYGSSGRNAGLFPIYLGSTELIRGYTSGSIINHECATSTTVSTGPTRCTELDQLIGTQIAVGNVELRFPLTRSLVLGFLPIGLPPIEGALFYDAGVAWDSSSTVKWNRKDTDNPLLVRSVLRSYGGSIRVNFLGFVILRFDVTKPLNRPHNKAYWTISLGPTF
ncbi:MAG TPA: BamA/TamA family outer membrane protein [Gemmatimonadales bacterium]|nr:BamA/TamA family outer membrane protein [Gemmatimonadales bacterium]